MFPFNVKTCTGFVHVKNPINQLMGFIQGSYTSPLKNHTVISNGQLTYFVYFCDMQNTSIFSNIFLIKISFTFIYIVLNDYFIY